MTSYIHLSVSAIVIGTLAACGGSTTGGTGGAFVFENKAGLEALQADTQFTRTAAADLPGGSATYEGFVQIANTSNVVPAIQGAEAVGVAIFEIGLAGGGTFTGSATDFQDAAGAYTGTLAIENGTIGDDPVIAGGRLAVGEISGMLTRESGEDIAIEGRSEGRFLGDEGEWFAGSTNQVTAMFDGTDAMVEVSIHGERQ